MGRWATFLALVALQTLHHVTAINFPYEKIQLTDADVADNPDIAFASASDYRPPKDRPTCRALPGDKDWPSSAKWEALNESLGGALIKGVPPAYPCYSGPDFDETACQTAIKNLGDSFWYPNDPVMPMQHWVTGNTCPVPKTIPGPSGGCSFAGFSAYVVNASNPKQIQIAVNFARNNNLRLNIKNSGHDFLGKSTGGGSLSILTSHFKDFEYIPSYKIRGYHGMAARAGVGIESFEIYKLMDQYNITMLVPGGATVGGNGGFLLGGGHTATSSRYGLMADQVLSLEVVTADGRFVHASPDENEELFYALRGGGGSTFGVITSVVIKVYPATIITEYTMSFTTTDSANQPGLANETFWAGVAVFFAHVNRICDEKATGNNYVRVNDTTPVRTFTWTLTVHLPGKNASEATEFLAPYFNDLKALGIVNTNAKANFYNSLADQYRGRVIAGTNSGGSRFGSRFFPRENFEDPTSHLFKRTMQAIRDFSETGGYVFHSVNFHATEETIGYPGLTNSVNPAFRRSAAHATGFDFKSYSGPPEEWIANHNRLNEFLQKWRDVTPGSGAYLNEADTEEPNFQQSFYGSHYPKLLKIKRALDPWDVFYARTAVGSDRWEVRGTGGIPSQNGRLCRV